MYCHFFDAKMPWDWSQQVKNPRDFNDLISIDFRPSNRHLFAEWKSSSTFFGFFRSSTNRGLSSKLFYPTTFDNFKFPAKINRKPWNSTKISRNSQTRKLEINWNSAQKWENFRKIISLTLNRSFLQIDRVSLYNLKENLELVVACFSLLFQWIKYHSPTS